MNRKVELLAPAGNFDALKAAIENGANAIYLGGSKFNARGNAKNFQKKEMIEAIDYAHKKGVEIHVAINILLEDSEIKDAIDYIKFLYDIGVDAIIIQDIGLASLVRDIFPDLPIHASTQMTINNYYGAKYLEKLGFKRVVLARETPFSEIKKIRENTNLEIEVFIHGALCISYSGQCLMSSLIGKRSGNRGECAQPCRKEYLIYNNDKKLGNRYKYFLSTKDLSSKEYISKFMKLGINSFKIEGRMKSPEYVAVVVSSYRKIIDDGLESLSKNELDNMRQIFNRGFTKGHTFGAYGKDYISLEKPKNRGLLVGKVINRNFILLDKNIYEGDGISYILNSGKEAGQKINKNYKKGNKIKVKPNLKIGSYVYRTYDKKLMEDAKKSYNRTKNNRLYPLDIEGYFLKNNKPLLIFTYKNITIEIEDEFIIENSTKRPLTENIIKDRLNRLGDTNYFINNLNLKIDDNIFMPISIVNRMKNKAIEELTYKRLGLDLRKKIDNNEYNKLKHKYMSLDKVKRKNKEKYISIKLNTIEQLKAITECERIYIDALSAEIREILNYIKDFNKFKNSEIYLYTGRILYSDDFEHLDNVIYKYGNIIDGISVSNIGTLFYIKKQYGNKYFIHGDLGLNIFNSYSAKFYYMQGVDSISLSVELTIDQINKIISCIEIDTELYSYGYLPSMVMRNCPTAIIKKCDYNENCKECKFNKNMFLLDRKGYKFPYRRQGKNTVLYNSKPLFILDEITRINGKYFRLDFNIEDNTLVHNISEIYYEKMKHGKLNRKYISILKKIKSMGITKGHYFRGVI